MTTPISDLALLSDCQSAALASRDGTIVWWPSPRFDSPSAFSSLLDADAGHWTIRPRGEAQASRRYCDGSLVLETMFRAADGVVRLTARERDAVRDTIPREAWCEQRLAFAGALGSWLAGCHARAGRLERARAVFERAAAAASDLGLLAEEIDVASGQPLGNMPQAISHIGLVHAAVAITEARGRQAVEA